jgi:ubiquinone/menaquinone biosynthesis C-methylase UbiE
MSHSQTQPQTKGYKGMPMEGLIATWYARSARDQNTFKPLADKFQAMLAPGSRILEVAPGPGLLSIELAKRGFHVTGLDISKTFVEIAKTNAHEANVKVDFQLGNASQMPLDDNQFDFLVCTAAFKNFSEPVLALDEMHRVLRPGGQAMINDLRGDAPNEAIDREIAGMHMNFINAAITKLTFQTMLLKNAYTPDAMRALVAQSLFRTCDIQTDAVGMDIWLTK